MIFGIKKTIAVPDKMQGFPAADGDDAEDEPGIVHSCKGFALIFQCRIFYYFIGIKLFNAAFSKNKTLLKRRVGKLN